MLIPILSRRVTELFPAAVNGRCLLLLAKHIAVAHAIHDRVERWIIGMTSSRIIALARSVYGKVNFKSPFSILPPASKANETAIARGCDLIFAAVGVLLALEGQAGAHDDSFTPHTGNSRLASAQHLFEDITKRPACVDVAVMKCDEVARNAAVAVKE